MRRTQPQGGPHQIDPGNPIGRGIVLECRADQQMYDVVHGIQPPVVAGTSVTKGGGPLGVATVFATSVLGFGDLELFTGAQGTFQIIEQPTNLTQVSGLIDKRTSGTGSNSFSLGYNYTTSNRFSVELGSAAGTGGGVHYQFSTGGFNTAVPNNLVIVINGQEATGQRIKLYKNGVEVSAITITGDAAFTTFTNTTSPLEIGRVNNSTAYYSGKIFLVRAWDRALSVEEVMSITANPWQVFKAPKPIYLYKATTGGILSYSYTATGGLSLAGTSERLVGATREPSGGIVFSGEGGRSYEVIRTPVGGLIFSGVAGYSTGGFNTVTIVPSGGIIFSGNVLGLQSSSRTPSGGILFSGHANTVFDDGTGGGTGVTSLGAYNDVWAGKLRVLGGIGALNDMINENTYWRGLLGGSAKPLNDVKREVLGEGQINDVEKAYWRDL